MGPSSHPSTSPIKAPKQTKPIASTNSTPVVAPAIKPAAPPVSAEVISRSDAPSSFPSSRPSFMKVVGPQCSETKACSQRNLTGLCCPTVDNVTLACCVEAKIKLPVQAECSQNAKCSALGLNGFCCPTMNSGNKSLDNFFLDCCTAVPDQCQAKGACKYYSAAQYKLDIAGAASQSAASANEWLFGTVATTLLALAVVAL